MAPKINETVVRTEIERRRAIENAGYQAARSGCYTNLDNPYFNGDDGDNEAWNDGFMEYCDKENDC